MTREDFDRQKWHKGMRCYIVVGAGGKRSYGTIINVLFGAQRLGIKFDGKDFVEKVNCERVTLVDE